MANFSPEPQHAGFLSAQYRYRKVPEITAMFWIIKLLTTAMGESTSDFFVFKFNPYVAVVCGGVVFLLALLLQFSVKRYIPWVYWFTVMMVAVFGTMAADGLHVQLGVPYIASSLGFAVVLAIVFILWQKTEHTMSIHSINSRRRELFYWLTVSATFALGTATGDLTATTFGLGYFLSGIMFIVLFLLPGFAYKFFRLPEIPAFWIAYVLTRPLGASFADWMGKSKAVGGLGWGDGHVAIGLTGIIFVCVLFVSLGRKKAAQDTPRRV